MPDLFRNVQAFQDDISKIEFIARREGVPLHDVITGLLDIWDDSFEGYFDDYHALYYYSKPEDGNVGLQKTLTGGIVDA